MHVLLSAIEEHPFPQYDFTKRESLTNNLLFIYGLIIASEPLLETAIQKTPYGELRSYYERHLEEEKGHATWLLFDLQSIDVDPPLVDWGAAQIAGMQYYLINHVSTQALLGYIAALECRPASMELVDELESIHGKQACRTLRYHAEHDLEHGKALLAFIDQLPNANLELIAKNAAWTAWAIRQALLPMSLEAN